MAVCYLFNIYRTLFSPEGVGYKEMNYILCLTLRLSKHLGRQTVRYLKTYCNMPCGIEYDNSMVF